MDNFAWTTGGKENVVHISKIASGAYGEVHKISTPLGSKLIFICQVGLLRRYFVLVNEDDLLSRQG